MGFTYSLSKKHLLHLRQQGLPPSILEVQPDFRPVHSLCHCHTGQVCLCLLRVWCATKNGHTLEPGCYPDNLRRYLYDCLYSAEWPQAQPSLVRHPLKVMTYWGPKSTSQLEDPCEFARLKLALDNFVALMLQSALSCRHWPSRKTEEALLIADSYSNSIQRYIESPHWDVWSTSTVGPVRKPGLDGVEMWLTCISHIS